MRTYRVVTDEERKRIMERSDAGASVREIADSYGRSAQTVHHVLVHSGRRRRSTIDDESPKPEITVDTQVKINAARDLIPFGAIAQVAAIAGVDLRTACLILGHPIPGAIKVTWK